MTRRIKPLTLSPTEASKFLTALLTATAITERAIEPTPAQRQAIARQMRFLNLFYARRFLRQGSPLASSGRRPWAMK